MYNTIELRSEPHGVVWVTLARPEKHNAMSAEMLDELTAAAQDLALDPSVRVVVLAATGASFCAGGDLAWMKAQFEADDLSRSKEAERLAGMLEQLDALPKPLIARVHGNAFGGGVGLMAVCDVVVASDDAQFALTETRLGLIPATIGPYVFERIGSGASRRYFGSGRRLSALDAKKIGLVSECVAPEDLDRALADEVLPWLDCAPGAVADAKKLLKEMAATGPEKMRALTERALADRWLSKEAHDGIGAFFSKADPPWRLKSD